MSPRSISEILENLARHDVRLGNIERSFSATLKFLLYGVAGPLWVGLLLVLASVVVK